MTGTGLVPAAPDPAIDDHRQFSAWVRKHPFTRKTTLLKKALDEDKLVFAKILLKKGYGRLMLAREIANGNDNRAEKLIACGADLHAESTISNPNPPLHEACAKNNIRIAKALLAAGCNIDHKGCLKTTALLEAVFHDSKEAVELLIEHGADPVIGVKKDMTAAVWAHKENRSYKILLARYEHDWRNPKKPALLPPPPKDGWSVANGDVVIRAVNDETSGTRIKNIFDFAAGHMITEVTSSGNTPQIAVTAFSAVKPEFLAQAEQKRNAKPQTPGLI